MSEPNEVEQWFSDNRVAVIVFAVVVAAAALAFAVWRLSKRKSAVPPQPSAPEAAPPQRARGRDAYGALPATARSQYGALSSTSATPGYVSAGFSEPEQPGYRQAPGTPAFTSVQSEYGDVPGEQRGAVAGYGVTPSEEPYTPPASERYKPLGGGRGAAPPPSQYAPLPTTSTALYAPPPPSAAQATQYTQWQQ